MREIRFGLVKRYQIFYYLGLKWKRVRGANAEKVRMFKGNHHDMYPPQIWPFNLDTMVYIVQESEQEK